MLAGTRDEMVSGLTPAIAASQIPASGSAHRPGTSVAIAYLSAGLPTRRYAGLGAPLRQCMLGTRDRRAAHRCERQAAP